MKKAQRLVIHLSKLYLKKKKVQFSKNKKGTLIFPFEVNRYDLRVVLTQ